MNEATVTETEMNETVETVETPVMGLVETISHAMEMIDTTPADDHNQFGNHAVEMRRRRQSARHLLELASKLTDTDVPDHMIRSISAGDVTLVLTGREIERDGVVTKLDPAGEGPGVFADMTSHMGVSAASAIGYFRAQMFQLLSPFNPNIDRMIQNEQVPSFWNFFTPDGELRATYDSDTDTYTLDFNGLTPEFIQEHQLDLLITEELPATVADQMESLWLPIVSAKEILDTLHGGKEWHAFYAKAPIRARTGLRYALVARNNSAGSDVNAALEYHFKRQTYVRELTDRAAMGRDGKVDAVVNF